MDGLEGEEVRKWGGVIWVGENDTELMMRISCVYYFTQGTLFIKFQSLALRIFHI